ncbi:MAG: tetratricopeptide repeat protein [Phycisphaerales bacterium]|nr:tetratricopeptide repeat protein [Phycisphaerales bacterium]
MKNFCNRGSFGVVLVALVLGTGCVPGCQQGEKPQVKEGPRGEEGARGSRPLHAMRDAGDTFMSVGNYAQAADEYQQYADVQPSNADVRYKLGRCYMEIGRFREAKESLQVAYNLEPDNEAYIDAYAEALMRSGENELLFAFLTKVVNERGKATDYLRMGEYAAKIGNPDDAIAALLTAAKLDGGTNVRYQLALARFYKQVGDRSREVERLRMASYLAPNNQEIRLRAAELGEIIGPTWPLRPLEQELGPSADDRGIPAGRGR